MVEKLESKRLISRLPTVRAGCEQARNALDRGDYSRALAELDRALVALKQEGIADATLRREWSRISGRAQRFPGPSQRLYDSRGEILELAAAVERQVGRTDEPTRRGAA